MRTLRPALLPHPDSLTRSLTLHASNTCRKRLQFRIQFLPFNADFIDRKRMRIQRTSSAPRASTYDEAVAAEENSEPKPGRTVPSEAFA